MSKKLRKREKSLQRRLRGWAETVNRLQKERPGIDWEKSFKKPGSMRGKS